MGTENETTADKTPPPDSADGVSKERPVGTETLTAVASGARRLQALTERNSALGWLATAGIAMTFVGVFSTWKSGSGVTLNGIEGPHNGWAILILTAVTALCVGSLKRWSPAAIAFTALAGVLNLVTLLGTRSVPGFATGWGFWLTGLGGGAIIGAAVWALWLRRSSASPLTARPERRFRFLPRGSDTAVVFAAVAFLLLRQIIFIGEDPSWPPPPDAITAAGAQAAVEEFAAGNPSPDDVGLDYAWSTAASIDAWPDGDTFYPLILEDIASAESSIHILMFGWKDGEVGREFTDLLVSKLGSGVEVRILVDSLGSRPFGSSKDMYDTLVDAGAQVVVNDTLPLDGDGLLGNRTTDWSHDELGAADHRKLYVIDGTVAWTGGAGIEDHFRNGEFHDVMVRVTGDVVLQSQAVFLTSFRSHDAPIPADLDRYFPVQPDPGTVPIAVVQVVPGGFSSAGQSIRELIDNAETRLDIMNPYLTDRDIIERIIAAANRGVSVRVVISKNSNNFMAAAATRHRYGDLLAAGVEVYEYPDAVVHAKLIVADDSVHFGTVNLDAWALYRDFEFAFQAESPEAARQLVERVFEPDIAVSTPAEPAGGFDRIVSWLSDKITYVL